MIPASVGFQCPECVREGQASVRAPRRTGGLQAAGRRWGAVTLTLIAANVAMVALAFWLIRLGLAEDRGRPFGAGVAYLLLWTVLRYVDLFGAFGGMLGAAAMFFLCGATLFGVALYWRNRKAVSLA